MLQYFLMYVACLLFSDVKWKDGELLRSVKG